MKKQFLAGAMGLALFLTLNDAQAQLGKAEVQGIKGFAAYSFGGGSPMPVRRGLALPAGSVVRVERDSAVDLYLGTEAGNIRLTQGTVLGLDKLDHNQTLLTLSAGQVVGWNARIPATSEYQVKLPNGIVGILEGKYRLDARAYLVLLEGTLVFGYVPPGGKVTPYTLRAPPAVYFSPVEGVRPAPTLLQREVEGQSKAKLR